MITSNTTPEQRYRQLFEEMYKLCIKNSWGDPFSYARSREIYMATVLGHRLPTEYSGADGIDENGNKVEYKSTIAKKINATYNGISVQPTWEEQGRYLTEEKIGCYPHHFFARFESGKIAEMWKAPGDKVLEKLMPKLEKSFHNKKKDSKDPRLGATLSTTVIKEIAVRVI